MSSPSSPNVCCLFIFGSSFVVDSLVPPCERVETLKSDLFSVGLNSISVSPSLKRFCCSTIWRRIEWFGCLVASQHTRRFVTRRCPMLQFHYRYALPSRVFLAWLPRKLSGQSGLHSRNQRSAILLLKNDNTHEEFVFPFTLDSIGCFQLNWDSWSESIFATCSI